VWRGLADRQDDAVQQLRDAFQTLRDANNKLLEHLDRLEAPQTAGTRA